MIKARGQMDFLPISLKFFRKKLCIFFVRAINSAFKKGVLSFTQKQGIIVCIPKENKPKQYLKNWRLILYARLKTVLDGLIHKD